MKMGIGIAYFDTLRFAGLMEMMKVTKDSVKVSATCTLVILLLCSLARLLL